MLNKTTPESLLSVSSDYGLFELIDTMKRIHHPPHNPFNLERASIC